MCQVLFSREVSDVAGCQGVATGEVAMVIESPPERGEKQKRRSTVKLGIKLEIIPTPPRSLTQPLTHTCCAVLPSHFRVL